MCGIVGIITPNPSFDEIQRITDLLIPRGLDDVGIYSGGGYWHGRPASQFYREFQRLLTIHRSRPANLSHLLTGVLTTQIWHSNVLKDHLPIRKG